MAAVTLYELAGPCPWEMPAFFDWMVRFWDYEADHAVTAENRAHCEDMAWENVRVGEAYRRDLARRKRP